MKTKNFTHIRNSLKKINNDVVSLKNKGLLRETTKVNSDSVKQTLDHLSDQIKHTLGNSKFNLMPATEKFFTTFGVEYTFLQRFNSKKDDYKIADKMRKASDKRQYWNKMVHPDGEHVIEFASPVHKNWEDMLKHYRIIKNNARKHNLVYKRQDCTGGGAHIHMGLPQKWSTEFKLKFLKNFYADIAFRPYLNWFFNDILDDINANSMFTSDAGCKVILQILDSSYFLLGTQNARSTYLLDLGLFGDIATKDYALRYDSEFDTVELRIFKMVENEKVLEDYVEFANAYFRHIYNITKDCYSQTYEIDIFREYSNEKNNYFLNIPNNLFDRFKNKKYTIKRFNEFLETIGLKSARYKKYIRNYEERLKLHKNKEVKMDFDMTKSFTWPSRLYSGTGNLKEGGIEFKTSTSELSQATPNDDISVDMEISPDVILNESLDGVSEARVLEVAREVCSDTNESAQPLNEQTTTQTEDPLKKLNMLSRVLTGEVVSKLTETPRRGKKIKITVSTTW